MQESTSYNSSTGPNKFPLPLALSGVLTPAEYAEQAQFGLLRDIFKPEPVIADSEIEKQLYHPYFVN